jgi:hypothetical protein
VELHPDMIYLQRLDAGLFTVQMVDLVLAELCILDTSIRQHASMLLKRNGYSFEDVCIDIAGKCNDLDVWIGSDGIRRVCKCSG